MSFFSTKIGSLILIVFIAFINTACSTNSKPEELEPKWPRTIEGLSNYSIFNLKFIDDHLYAATDKGLYKRITNDKWMLLSPEGYKVFSFVKLAEKKYLASVYMEAIDSSTIAKTVDGGRNWIPFRNGYSGSFLGRIIPTIMVNASAPGLIYAGGAPLRTVAKSTNQSQTWTLTDGNVWGSLGGLYFINVDSRNSDNVWYGGSNALSFPFIYHSVNGGESWELLRPLEKLHTGSANDIVVNTADSDILLAGLSSIVSPNRGVFKSIDGGQTWSRVYEGINTETFARSARDPSVIYASGRNAPGTLFFAVSTDFGETWKMTEIKDSQPPVFVSDMVSVMQNGQEVLYFGTQKGLYHYTFEE